MKEPSTRNRRFIVALSIAFFTLVIPLYCLSSQGVRCIFNHLAADAFYYLTIAKNSTTGFYTYDGEVPVNSFHPLWQYLLTGVFQIIGRSHEIAQLYAVYLLGVLFTTIGSILAGLSIYNTTRSTLLSILIIPGIYSFLMGCASIDRTAYWLFIPPWSSINGMETSLSILFGGALLYVGLKPTNAGRADERDGPDAAYFSDAFLLKLGVLIAMIVMSRLDDVFLLAAFSGSIVFARNTSFRNRIRGLLVLCFPTALVLVPYMVFNYWTTNAILPLSGLGKAGLALSTNFKWALSTLLPAGIEPAGMFSKAQVDRYLTMWPLSSWRVFQVVMPMALSAIFLVVIFTTRAPGKTMGPQALVQVCLLAYVLLKGAYNIVAVDMFHQGWWYYPLSITVVNVVGLQLLAGPYREFVQPHRFRQIAVWILVGLLMGSLSAKYVFFKTNTRDHRRVQGQSPNEFYRFWKDREQIRNALLAEGRPLKIVEFDDGIVSYSLDIPTANALHATDGASYRAKQRGDLLAHLHSRGFNTLASLFYLKPYYGHIQSIEEIESKAQKRFGDRFKVRVLYRHEPTGALFIGFEPRK